MKIHMGIVGVLLVTVMESAFGANCVGSPDENRLNATEISTALSNKTINAVAPSGEDWKEAHCAGGALYKAGDGTAVDPRALRGTWSVTGSGNDRTVTYNYTGGPTYTWSMYQNKTTNVVYFCNGSTEIARIVSSTNGAGSPCN